jgi:deoxyribodipyrimidine photo-lyase
MFAATRDNPLLLILNGAAKKPEALLYTPKTLAKTIVTVINYKMAQKKTQPINSKRKPLTSPELSLTYGAKKLKSADSTDPISTPDPKSQVAENNGIILRAFYGPEMSNERALAYKEGKLPRPIEILHSALTETRSDRERIEVKGAVVHWFRCDLRVRDNRALRLASEKASEKNVPLIAMYIVSPQDFDAHFTSPARVDFVLRTLQVLKDDLEKLNIPLYVETVEKRKRVPERILKLLAEWGSNHLFANMELEVDELRRDQRLVRACLERGISMDVLADTCVVPPGELATGAGTQYSVYTPWFRSWAAHIHNNPELLDISEEPAKNPSGARESYVKLFESTIPSASNNKKLTDGEKKRFHSMWPPGEHEAHKRLKRFAQQRIEGYEARRNFPAEDATSSLSVHLASGTLSARTAVRAARDHNTTKRLDGGDPGIQAWIREVAWRDFYKHILAHWPYIWYDLFPLSRSFFDHFKYE